MRNICFALLLAGCGDQPIEHREADEVARIIGATIATPDGGATMGALTDVMTLAFGDMPDGFTLEAGMVDGGYGSLAHHYLMFQCRDREGTLLEPCTQHTNTATVMVAWSGAIERDGLDLRSSRQAMWKLGSLQSWLPGLSGDGSVYLDGTVDGHHYKITGSDAGVLVRPEAWGGSLHFDLVIERDEIESVRTAEVIFDYLDDAVLSLDDSYLYAIDTQTGAVR